LKIVEEVSRLINIAFIGAMIMFLSASTPEAIAAAIITSERGGADSKVVVPLVAEKKVYSVDGVVEGTLAQTLKRNNVPDNVQNAFIHAFDGSIDLRRDVKQGDLFSLTWVKEGHPLFVSCSAGLLYVKLSKLEGWYFQNSSFAKVGKFYTKHGEPLHGGLVMHVVDGSIISSPYGLRVHPVTKVRRMHKGVDFAAKQGKDIFAAGDGVIERIGRRGGYGNAIVIRHDSHHKTMYAHLNQFAKNLRQGSRVRQGQVIGYLGTTGISTGDHLHLELYKDGKAVSPFAEVIHERSSLIGNELRQYQERIVNINALMTGE